MTYWDDVLTRLSIPGLALLVLGMVCTYLAPTLSRWLFKQNSSKAEMPIKLGGFVLAVLGALILLDFIPIK